MRYARLTRDWLLRGWSDSPFALLNWKTGRHLPLDGHIAHVVRHCDGETDFHSPLFLPFHDQLLDRLVGAGIAEDTRYGDGLAPQQTFRMAANPYQASLQWAITGGCNLGCLHCYMEAPSRLWKDMTTADLLAVVDQMERANLPQVSITGGEPFMRPDLLPIVRSLLERRIGILQIFTNGLLIKDAVLDELDRFGIRPDFCISFDGVGLHDRMRGRLRVETPVLAAMNRLRARGFPIIVSTSVDRATTSGALVATYHLMRDLGVSYWKVAAPVRTGNWTDTTTGIGVEEEERLYHDALRCWHDDGRPMDLQLGTIFNSRVDSVGAHCASRSRHYSPEDVDCGSCKRMPHLTADGTFLPCHAYSGRTPPPGMPNLRDRSLSDVLSGSATVTIINITKKELIEHNPGCGTCEKFSVCGMGCRARAYIETGDIYAKDPVACEAMKQGHVDRLVASIPRPGPDSMPAGA